MEEAEEILDAACCYVGALDFVATEEFRQGRRPIFEEGQSILWFSRDLTNLCVSVTQSGVTLALTSVETAALEILGDGGTVGFLDPFRLSRFS